MVEAPAGDMHMGIDPPHPGTTFLGEATGCIVSTSSGPGGVRADILGWGELGGVPTTELGVLTFGGGSRLFRGQLNVRIADAAGSTLGHFQGAHAGRLVAGGRAGVVYAVGRLRARHDSPAQFHELHNEFLLAEVAVEDFETYRCRLFLLCPAPEGPAP